MKPRPVIIYSRAGTPKSLLPPAYVIHALRVSTFTPRNKLHPRRRPLGPGGPDFLPVKRRVSFVN